MADRTNGGQPPRRFQSSHAVGEDWGMTAKACLEQLGPIPAQANLGFLYATDGFANDLASILTFLRERTGIQDWVGTVGLGIASRGAEVHDRPALAIMVAALPSDSFQIFQPLTANPQDLPEHHADWIERHSPVLGLVHGDPRNTELPRIVHDLSEEVPAYLVGGLSASQGESYPQIAGRVVEGGLSGVLFSETLPVVAGLTQGCSPIGPSREITDAERNVIKKIDGQPALEVFKADIGELLAQDLSRVAGYIYVAFPVIGTDTGDYLVRNLMGIDTEHGWIAVGEPVAPGQRVLFCRRDHDSAKQDLKRMLADVTKRAGNASKGGLYFSCVARGQHLFGPNSEELRLVHEAVGDIPLIGFFANGEICNNRIYSYTGVLTLFL